MKKLLIHSNNTSFNSTKVFSISEQFVFDVDFDKDVDFYIDDNLTEGDLKQKIEQSDVVFIKVSLSQNYLEYFGFRLAYHIRLTQSLGVKANIPIVFIAEESLQFLGLTYTEPSILFTGGIYLIKETIEDYQKVGRWFNDGNIKFLDDFNSFIKCISIHPPANYQSHHSIANEWSILRWAKVLDIPERNTLLQGVKKNIESLLYYKFLQSKYPIQREPNKANFKIQGKGKVLYIDDEWNKGWDVVFSDFISISPELENDFEVFEYDFKDKDEGIVFNDCKNKICVSDPAIVILDLRLAYSDFQANKKTSSLTGFKILQAVKDFNPGIRVIIFTASNKVWNLIELQNAGADGFVLKESPELGVNKNYSKETVEKFALIIQEQLKYQFQKDLFIKCKDVRRNLVLQTSDENEDYNNLIKTLIKQIDIIYSSISLINLKKQITLDIVFLTCYNFLELFKSYYLVYKKDYRYYLGFEDIDLMRYEISGKSIVNKGQFIANGKFDSPSWFVIQASLFIDYFKVSVSPDFLEVINLKRIADKRNDYIHSTKKSFDTAEVKLIIEALCNACKKIKE